MTTTAIRLRPTQTDDLDYVRETEQAHEPLGFIAQWTREQHAEALASDDMRHLIIEHVVEQRRLGYIILIGLQNSDQNLKLQRIVVTEKNRGYGRQAIKRVKALVFEELGKHRLWLMAKAHNHTARHLYESEGFALEGMLRECILTETRRESVVIMSMLRQEYEGQIP